jgi:hypothetical protein
MGYKMKVQIINPLLSQQYSIANHDLRVCAFLRSTPFRARRFSENVPHFMRVLFEARGHA